MVLIEIKNRILAIPGAVVGGAITIADQWHHFQDKWMEAFSLALVGGMGGAIGAVLIGLLFKWLGITGHKEK